MKSLKCRTCGFENQEGMKFCGNCGKPLIDLEKHGERKIISILYVDIAGFTSISETMDAENVQEMLNTIFENISYSINKYGGTVHKYIGDEVMALFGAPITYENHAERAAQAALEINKSIKDVTAMINLSIKLHIALHSGEVVFGKVGSEEIHDYTVIGDTVNIASRLEKIAPVDAILVSQAFKDRTEHAFVYESFGEIAVKGKSLPITCYLLKSSRTTRKKIRGINEVETPLLGREQEMAFLADTLQEIREKKLLQLVVLKGQPGIGKSRLFREFAKVINKEANLLFETRSLPFGQEELHPFKQLVRNITSVTADMQEEDAKKNIEAFLTSYFGTADIGITDFLDIILDLTSVKELELKPKRKQQIMYYMLENLFKKLAEKKTLVIAFEDFHWAESSSLLLLRHLIDFLQDIPILFLLITRPLLKDNPINDFLTIYSDQIFSSVLDLKPLDKSSSFKLISNLLSIDRIPSDVKEKIVKRGEGNPLFIEELIKVLMEKKLIYKEGDNWKANKDIEVFDIPQTINEIVMGRVDLLETMEKQILQYASVIGRIFWDKPIREALNQTMVHELSSLSNKGFVQRKVESIFEDAKEYIFSHILIQESIYSSILKRVRKNTHAEFAQWLELNYPEMKNVISNLLAFHFEKGESWEKAGYYSIESGREASSNYNNKEALKQFNRALRILTEHKPHSKHFHRLYKSMGKLYSRIGSNEEAEKNLQRALELASSTADKFSIEQSLSNLYQKMSLYEKAREKLHLAKSYLTQKISKEAIDILFDEVWLHYLAGDIKQALKLLDDFEKIYKKLETQLSEKERENLLAQSYNKRAIILNYSGNLQDALKYYTKALDIYEKNNSRSGMAAVYNNCAGIYHSLGECSKAIDMYEKSQKLDEKTGNKLGTAIGYNNLAEMYIFLNDIEKAEDYLKRYYDLNMKIHNKLGFGYAYLNYGIISENKNNYRKALDYYKRALSTFEEIKSARLATDAHESLAWLFYHMHDFDASKTHIAKVSEYLMKAEIPDLKASLLRLQGKFCTEENNYQKAEELLNCSYSLYRDMANTAALVQLNTDFMDLYTKQGKHEKASQFKEKGKRLVEEILRGIEEMELQQCFTEKEDVQKLLN